MFRFLYNLLWWTVTIIMGIPLLIYAAIKGENIIHRLGIYGEIPKSPIWIHASSVGESAESISLAIELKNRLDIPLLLTSTTITGYRRLKSIEDENCYVRLLAADNPLIIKTAISRIRPRIMITIEADFWLNKLYYAKRFGAKTIVASGKIARPTRNIFKKLYYKNIFANLDCIYARDEEQARNFLGWGARPEKVVVLGDLKIVPINAPPDTPEKPERFPIIVAGSVRSGEEKIILDAFVEIRERFPDALLIAAPRHPHEVERFEKALLRGGFDFAKRSQSEKIPTDKSVYLVDTIGELIKFYAICDAVIVCGTFVDYGGHNPWEAISLGKPVIHGKFTRNNSTLFRIADDSGATLETSAEELGKKLAELFSSPEKIENMSRIAKEICLRLGKTAEIYAKKIVEILSDNSSNVCL